MKNKKMKISVVMLTMLLMPKLSFAQEHSVSASGNVSNLQDVVYDVRMNVTDSIVWNAKEGKLATSPSIQIDNKSTADINLYLQDIELSGDWTPKLLHETYHTDDQWSELSAKEAPNGMTLMLKLRTQPGFYISYNLKNSVDNEYSISKSTSDNNFLVKNATTDSIEEYYTIKNNLLLGSVEEDALIELPISMKAARKFRETKSFNVNFLLSASII